MLAARRNSGERQISDNSPHAADTFMRLTKCSKEESREKSFVANATPDQGRVGQNGERSFIFSTSNSRKWASGWPKRLYEIQCICHFPQKIVFKNRNRGHMIFRCMREIKSINSAFNNALVIATGQKMKAR